MPEIQRIAYQAYRDGEPMRKDFSVEDIFWSGSDDRGSACDRRKCPDSRIGELAGVKDTSAEDQYEA